MAACTAVVTPDTLALSSATGAEYSALVARLTGAMVPEVTVVPTRLVPGETV